nr:hypothetical protein [uncultured Albidiferax sp.]
MTARTSTPEFHPATSTDPLAFPTLESVTRPTVDTATAAYYLNRRPQTMRAWAMRDGTGPIRALRINGRLAWPVAELRRVLGVAA